MKPKHYLKLLTMLLLLLPATGFSQGTMIPIRPPDPRPPGRYGPFYVKSMKIDVDVTRQVAVTSVEQVFANPADRDQEGMYLFPVPKTASVTRFTMWMNGTEVEGELVEAGRARRIYEDIVRRMRDPGLLEYVGCGLFRARVYPIPARGEVRIRIEYAELLSYDGGVVGYRFPMKQNRPAAPPVERVSLAVDIESDVPVKSLYSPTHEIDARIDGRRASCGFEHEAFVPGRDFVLYYTVSEEEVGLNLLTHRTDDGSGYFMMLLSPGHIGGRGRFMDKDIVFVVDKSGSMKGEKIEQVKRALSYCVNSLGEGDRFNIVAFSTAVDTYADKTVSASRDEKRRAVRFIEGIRARGGTDINGALLRAMDEPDGGRPRYVVFLTDGMPTVGETRIESILDNLEDAGSDPRIFCFGVGYDVNTELLDRLGIDFRGTVDYVKPEEDIEVRVSRFYDKIGNPVLSDVSVDVDGVRLFDVYPRRLPDLFDGTQLVVIGRYEGHGSTPVVLSGKVGERARRFTYEGDFGRHREANAFIPRLWAGRRIAWLLSEIRLHGRNRELVDAVIELSLEHGIVTPYTSWLILEEGSGRDRMVLRNSVPPPGAAGPTVGGTAESVEEQALRAGDGFKSTSGGRAFDLSRTLAEDRESSVVKDEKSGLVRFVGGSRFVNREGEWVDSRFEPDMDTEEIAFLSDEYFGLIEKYPGVEKYLALGSRVTFVFENRAYRITD